MSVGAIVKHHQAVTAIIAQAMSDYASSATGSSWNNACFAFEADAIFSALSRAGYHIIGPGEQAVTEAMVVAAQNEIQKSFETVHWEHGVPKAAVRNALKAAMEAKE